MKTGRLNMQETLEGLVDQERVQVLARTMLELKKEKAHISSMLKNIEKQIDDVSKEMIKMVAGSMIKVSGLEHDIEWVYIGETGMAGHWRDPWTKKTVMLSTTKAVAKKGLLPKKDV